MVELRKLMPLDFSFGRDPHEKSVPETIMEIVENVLTVTKAIYDQCQQVKCCKNQSQRLVARIQILLPSIEALRAQSSKQTSPKLEEMLQRLLTILKQAKALLVKYSHQNWLQKFLKAGDVMEEFTNVNRHLSDAAHGVLLLLQVEQTILAKFGSDILHQEDRQDLEADRISWEEEMLKNSKEIKDSVDNVNDAVKGLDNKIEQILRKVEESLQVGPRTNTKIFDKEITEIDKSVLTRTIRLLESDSYVLYKGEYHKSPVAIKVFKNPVITSIHKVRDLFEKDIKIMKKFQSPYILRLYGICIEESDPSPKFSTVMEYCEKGSMREVLQRKPDLSWKIRLKMALHAALGLYRLHQTEKKAQLHGCINSTKFLVAEGYCVKLSGFELCKTESSIRRKPKDETYKVVCASVYICPESLASVNHQYNLPSEIYSFGIVLWEIATGKIPFGGCTSQEIHEKVCKERYQEPLGEDCPSDLQDIINQCRDHDPSMRPSAKDIVDTLWTISTTTTVTG